MDFGWLKRLFKKKNLSNVNTSDIATIDTSFVYVPKYEELSENEKQAALEDLKVLMNDDSYETLLKYSNDLVDISNRERFILSKTLERYYDWFADNKNPLKEKSKEEQLGNSICYGTLANLEFEIIEGKIKEIGEKLKIRAVALDLYVKEKEKEEKKNKSIFQRYFSVANRLEMENFKNRMASEKERIKVSMKINEQILQTIEIDKRDNDTLKNAYELLKVVSDNSIYVDSSFNNMDVKSSLIKLLYRCFYILKNTELYAKFKERIEQFIKQYQDNTTFAYHAPYGSDNFIHKLASPSYLELEHIIPDYMMEEIFKIVAGSMHDAEIYCYEHKDEIKEYIESLKKKILEYETTPTKDWDKEHIDELLIESHNFKHFSIQKYLHGHCGNEEEEKELEELYTKLKFINIVKGIDIVRYSIVDIGKDMDNDTKNRLVDEILRKIEEKYDVSISKINPLFSKKIEKYREEFIEKNYDHCIYLFDLLNKRECNDNVYQQRLDYDSSRSISLEDYCYMMLLLDNNLILNYFVKPDDEYNLSTSYDEWYEFVTNVRYEQIKRYHDKRIIIVPKKVWIGKLNFDTHDLSSIDNYQNIKAIYTEPHCGLSTFLGAMKYSAEIYIISKEKEMDNQYSKWEYDNPIGDWRSATYLYKDYDGIYMNLDYKDDYIHVYTYHAEKGAIGKLIIVPDNTEYSDLSFYLDQVLEMEKEQLKVLNKTL